MCNGIAVQANKGSRFNTCFLKTYCFKASQKKDVEDFADSTFLIPRAPKPQVPRSDRLRACNPKFHNFPE